MENPVASDRGYELISEYERAGNRELGDAKEFDDMRRWVLSRDGLTDVTEKSDNELIAQLNHQIFSYEAKKECPGQMTLALG